MKVRTKFNSGLDKKDYMDGMFHEFLDVYGNRTEKQGIKRVNAELISQINDYTERYIYFQRVTTIIAAFIKQFENMAGILSKLLAIKTSVKKQNLMLGACKKILKNLRFDEKYEEPIRYTISSVNKRLDYLLAIVNSAYIEMTPLDNYKKKLEAEGKSFFDEIVNEFPLDERIGYDEDNEMLQGYIKKVLASFSDDGEWKEGFEKYNAFLVQKYEKIEEGRRIEKMKAKKERQEMAEKKLMNESNMITKRYEDAMITMGYHPGINHLHNEIYKLKKEGHQRNKIVLLAKTLKGYDAAVHYFSKTTKDLFAKSMIHCSVLDEFEELPSELLEQVKNCDVAMVEVVLE